MNNMETLKQILYQILSLSLLAKIILFIITAIVGSLISMVVKRLVSHTIDNLIIRIFRKRVKKERNITGLWITHYKYPSSTNKGKINIEKQLVKLEQHGSVVVGETIWAQKQPETFEGTIKGRYFTGIYINSKDEHNYHGAFQYIISNSENKMEGLWIGFNRKGDKIISGEWRWIQKYKSVSLPPDIEREVVEETKNRDLFNENFIL